MSNRASKNLGEIPSFVVEAYLGCTPETKELILQELDVETVTPQVIVSILNIVQESI